MKMSRYFRGDFKSKADGEFTASRSLTVSGIEYGAGDPFDKDSVSGRTLRLLYENRKIDAVDSVSNGQEGTLEHDEGVGGYPSSQNSKTLNGDASESESEPAATATIVEGKAGWLHVENERGEKIGSSTRDEAEAAEIKRAYLAGEPIPE